MSDPHTALVADLEDLFVHKEASTRNSIRASDGELVRIDTTLWNASAVLTNHLDSLPDNYYNASCTGDMLRALVQVHRNKNYPLERANLLKLLCVAEELKLETVVQNTFRKILRHRELQLRSFPRNSTFDMVFTYFKKLMECPLRSLEIYKYQFDRISKHFSKNHDVLEAAFAIFKLGTRKYMKLDLSCLPISFETLEVPAAVVSRSGRRQTAIFHRNSWRFVEIFGKYFDLEANRVDDFHLDYGRYLLYRTQDIIFRKDLGVPTEAEIVLDNCTSLISRGRCAFAIRSLNKNESYLMSWTGRVFTAMHKKPIEAIVSIDYCCEQQLLSVLTESSSLEIFRVSEGCSLELVKTFELHVCDAFFHGEHLIVNRYNYFSDTQSCEVYSFSEVADSDESRKIFDSSYRNVFETDADVRSRGGAVFSNDESLRVFLKNSYTPSMFDCEFEALSEISLFPN